MIASFPPLGVDLIVLHSFVGSVLWSNVSTNCLHFCLLCSFVILVIPSFISCRVDEVESLDLRSSRALIFSNFYVGTGSVLSRCRPERMWCDATLTIMARNIFSLFWQLVGIRIFLRLSSISLLYQSQFTLFRLMLERCCNGLIVTSICKLMRICRWSESRFVFVCQLVEVMREADANDTPGELGLTLPGILVGEYQLRIPKLESDTMLYSIVPFEYVELEYHDEW